MRRLRLGRLAKRFGIAAPRVAVRTQLSWYWRWIGVILAGTCAILVAGWLYDAGRRYAGDDRGEIERELARAKSEADSAQQDLVRLRSAVDAADSKLAIERAAQQKLAEQVRSLEKDKARLREELAVFESMLASSTREGQSVAIQRFKVEPDVAPGEYRYRFLLFAPARRTDRSFQGRFELVLRLNEAGRGAMMVLPEKGNEKAASAAAFQLAFRHFRRVEGSFRVQAEAKLENIQLRIYEAGSDQVRATETISPR